MAKIVKTLTVSWQWSGDKYSLRGFNLAVTPAAKNPKEEVVATAFVETKEIKQTYSYKMGNVTLDKDAQYKIWVQAVYENSDSDWVATGGATVSDDGSATIITKTDREIQDIVNMASDNILTRQEKISLRREWQEIVYEFLEIESTAISQGIPSSNTAFSNFKSKGNALGTYLNGGTAWTISSNNKTSFPLWINDSNLGNNTSINGNTYRETFRVYYEAKVKILEEINKYKVNSVQVGGVNLLVGTATAKNTNVNTPTSFVTWDPYTTHNKQTLEQLGFKAGDKVTIGFDWSISKNGTNDYVYGNFRVEFRGIKSDGTDNQYLGVIKNPAGTFSSSNTKGRVEATVALDSTTIKAHSLRFRIDNSVLNFKVSNLKMERGTKATGWSPALEEMENAYTIILTNEAQVIPTNSNRVPTSSTTYFTDIQVYKGTLQRNDYTIGTVNSANGITVSKTSSRVNFAVSTNTALAADGGNFVIPITIDGKTFNKTFSWSCSKQGNTGDSGVGISKITEYYAVSSSNTTEPTSWSTTVPAMTATNKYLWNYETITYSNNTTANTSKRVIGVYGDKGNTGDTGATGNGVSKIVNYYLATSSSSGVTTSTSGWTTSVQAVSASKKYLWNYEVVTYTNGSTSTTTPCIIGTYGDKGDKGDKGDSAKNVTLTATSQVFKSTDGGKNFTPDSITIKPTYQNVSHSKWQHSLDGGKTWVDTGTNTNGVTIDGNGFTISKSSTLFTDKVTSIVVKDVTNNSSVYDTITITRLYDVTGIEVGGRNYVQDYKFQRQDIWKKNVGSVITIDNDNGWVVLNESTSNPYVYQFFDVSTFKVGEPLTLQYEIKCEGVSANTATNSMLVQTVLTGYESDKTFIGDKVNFGSHANNVANLTEWTKCTFTKNLPNDFTGIGFFAIRLYARNFRGKVYFRNVKLEKGNVATDLSPAPEDAELNIDDVKNNLSNFQTTVNSTFKDGIIEQAEAKAIAQHLKTLDAEKADVDKEYSTIYGNSLLKGTAKTNLEKAKKEFNNAHDSLKSTINTAISDGKITSTEKASVDSTFTTYNGILGTYKQRVQEALDAIGSAKVNNIQVGGTNIIRNSRNPKNLACWDANVTEFKVANSGDIGENVFKLTATTAERFASTMRYRVEPNCQYTFSMDVWMEANVNDLDVFWLSRPKGSTESYVNAKKIISNWNATKVKWVRIAASFTTASNDYEGFIRIDNNGSSSTTDYAIWFTKVKLEKGNKATDWSPAPEDLENSYTIVLTNEAQVIPTDNSRKPISSTTYYTDIQVYQGTTQRTDYTIGTINSANGITVSKTSSRVNFAVSTGTALTADGGNFTIPITIDGKTFNKTFSWSCSKQGNKGNDAYTVILTNESHTFPTKNDGSISSAISTTTQVLAYKGASSVTPEIGTLPAVDGLTLSKNKTTITIQANTGTSLADSGSFNIPVTVDGKSFTKTFSWSKSKKGDTGSKGDGAKSADIIASSQVFKSTDGGLTFSPATIKLTPKLQNVTYSNWQYSTNGGSSWNGFSNSISGWSVSNGVLTISKDSSLFTSTVTSVTFRLNTNDSSVYDTMTIVKLYDIADLEIGTRNLLLDTALLQGGKHWDHGGKWSIINAEADKSSNKIAYFKNTDSASTWQRFSTKINLPVTPNDKLTFSFDVKVISDLAKLDERMVIIRFYDTDTTNDYSDAGSFSKLHLGRRDFSAINAKNTWYTVSKTFTVPTGAKRMCIGFQMYQDGEAKFRCLKLEKGNKATDWTPAPEDVKSNIDDVKNSLNSFQNTVNTTFKDGVVEQAEAKAIAQHLKTLDAEKADIDKEYSAIYSNANLTGSAKTNLASAKTSFDSAHASLKSTINTVISDGRVSSSESTSVTSTFNTYSTQLGVYKQRVQEALDNISSGKVDKVEVGGRNLARKGSVVKYNSNASATTVNDANFTTDGSATISRTAVVNEGAMIDRYVVYDGGANYVAAFKMRTTSGTVNSIHFYNGRGHRNSKVYIDGAYKGTMGQDLTFPNDTNYHKVEVRFEAVATDSATANAQNTQHIIPQPMKGTASAYTIQILNLKIEKGNKATDWTPAPEDVKNHAEQSAQNAVDAQTQNSIFNKLTNNGQTQGIYLENSKIYINGEYIKANTLSADKVLVGDYTNYCQLTEQTPMSNKFNKYTHSDSTIWHEMKTLGRDTRISRDYSCKGGEKFRVTGYVYGKVTSMTSNGGSTSQENTQFRVGIFGTKTDGSKFYHYGDDTSGNSTGSIIQFSKIITLPSNAKTFYVVLHINGWTPMSGVARCRNIEVRRMNTGELIVDGSITAKSLHADVLSANSIVSIINGGSTNISGSKIRTGTIQSNNGKSTINLDNGSMNLGATSDASYLQWTGSALNIKANSVSIGATSVATTTDVTNGINKIDIGGKNLAKQTKLLTDVVLNGWTVTNTGNKGFKKLEIVTDNTSWQECNIPLYTEINTITKSVTVSFEYQETSSGLLMFSFGSYNGNTRVSEVSNVAVSSSFKVISTNGNWKTVSYTFDPTSVNNKDGITQYKIQFKKASGKTGTIYVRKPKLELGNKATDWSPAPEDVDANLSDLKETILGQVEEDVAGLQSQNSSIVNRLDEVFSENVVSSHQKPDLKLEFDTITSQYETMKSMVNEFNEPAITGQFNTLTTIYNTLKTEVTPIFKDMNVATQINGAILKSRFYNFYEQYNVVYLAIQTYVRGTLDKVNAQVNAVSDGVNMAITKSDSALETTNTISKHFNFTDSGWVEIFAMVNGVAGKFKTQITDQKLSFQESGKEVAYLSNQELYITQAQILNSLQLGNVGMTTTSKGGIMYQWRG